VKQDLRAVLKAASTSMQEIARTMPEGEEYSTEEMLWLAEWFWIAQIQ